VGCDQRDVSTGPAAWSRRVDQRQLDERASFTVESTSTSLQICDSATQRAVDGKISSSGQHGGPLDQRRSSESTVVREMNGVRLSVHARDGNEHGGEQSGEQKLSLRRR